MPNQSPTFQELRAIAAYAYNGDLPEGGTLNPLPPGWLSGLTPNYTTTKLLEQAGVTKVALNRLSLQVESAYNPWTNATVLTVSGTNPHDPEDLALDYDIMTNQYTQKSMEKILTISRITDAASNLATADHYQYYETGHSSAATVLFMDAAVKGYRVVGWDSPGIRKELSQVEAIYGQAIDSANFGNIINVVRAGSLISNSPLTNDHVGQVITVPHLY